MKLLALFSNRRGYKDDFNLEGLDFNGAFYIGTETTASLCTQQFEHFYLDFFFFMQQREPWGGLQKSKLVFSSHIFLIKVLVFTFAFALSRGMLSAKGEILKNILLCLVFRWKQGWVAGRLDKGWWMTEPGDLVQLIIIAGGLSSSSFSPMAPTSIQGSSRAQRSPAGELVSGLGRMEKVPEGKNHLWSYQCAREINMKHRIFTALSGVSCVFKCVAWRACRPAKDIPCAPLSAAASAPSLDLSPGLYWLCVVLLKGFSPQMISTVLKDCCEANSFLFFFPHHETDISHQPSASGNQLGSSAFDSLSIFSSSSVYSPTSFHI